MSNSLNPYEAPSDTLASTVADNAQRPAEFKSARLRGWASIIALMINIALALLSLGFDGRLFAAYSGFAVTDQMDAEWVTYQLDRVDKIAALIIGCRWLTAVCVISWMHRCHRNLTALGHRELDSKPLWVVLCWFVPIMNFFCPYQVMQEIWRRSDPGTVHAEPTHGTPLVTSWWLTWLATIAVGVFANHLAAQQEMEWDHWDMIWWSGAEILRSSLTIVAALLLIAIIVKLNSRQFARFLVLAQEQLP